MILDIIDQSYKRFIPAVSLVILVVGCSVNDRQQQPELPDFTEQEVATGWAEMSTYLTQYTPANSPTYASRCFGYIGLTMYESIVHGYPEYQSLAGQLNGLESLPLPEADVDYNWLLALNAGQAEILRRIYNQTSDSNKVKIDSLETVFYQAFGMNAGEETMTERSVAYGKAIAQAIFEWSKTDGGHRGYLHNFDKELEHHENYGGMTHFGQTFKSRISRWVEQNIAEVAPEEIDASGQDALDVQLIIEAAIESWDTGKVIDL